MLVIKFQNGELMPQDASQPTSPINEGWVEIFLNEPFDSVRTLCKTLKYFHSGQDMTIREKKYVELIINTEMSEIESARTSTGEPVILSHPC